MVVQIRSYKKVVESLTYLKGELIKKKLNMGTAILYFQILIDKEEFEIIERPLFSFCLDEFDKYLQFFKHYNFINSGKNKNSFRVRENWKDISEYYTIPQAELHSFIKMSKNHPELSSFYRLTA